MGDSSSKKQNNDKSGNAARKQQAKQEAAKERQAAYATLTLDEKLSSLAERPGSSRRERAKLARAGRGK